MSELLLGLLAWFIVALLVSLLIGRFMRDPLGEEGDTPARRNPGLSGGLPGYGRDEDDLAGPRTRF